MAGEDAFLAVSEVRLGREGVAEALRDVDADFAAMDVLPDPRIRQVLSARSGWPTIPQLFVEGELVGGCDITLELHESGELAQIVKSPA